MACGGAVGKSTLLNDQVMSTHIIVRMNVSAPRRFTTTQLKTSPRVHFHSEHERIIIRLRTSTTSKADMSSCNRFMGLALKQVAGTTALSPKTSETYLAMRAVSSPFPMCYNIVLPLLNWRIRPSRDIARSLLCSLLIHTFESYLRRIFRLRERTG